MPKSHWLHFALSGLICAGFISGCTMISGNEASTPRDVPVRYGKTKPATGEIVVVPPRKPGAPEKAAKPSQPSNLIGQSVAEIEQTFGQPLSIRDEKPALVYLYGSGRCTLSIVFFMDIERNQFRALSYDVRATGGETESPEDCLGAIQNAKAKP